MKFAHGESLFNLEAWTIIHKKRLAEKEVCVAINLTPFGVEVNSSASTNSCKWTRAQQKRKCYQMDFEFVVITMRL